MQALQLNKYRAQAAGEIRQRVLGRYVRREDAGQIKRGGQKNQHRPAAHQGGTKGFFPYRAKRPSPAKLALVLQAFNKCAAVTGLNIESVSITDKVHHHQSATLPARKTHSKCSKLSSRPA